tara:strand:- start:1976 stop:2497 length:522 start_codon:yes stop_codon:yes gene_type:complete
MPIHDYIKLFGDYKDFPHPGIIFRDISPLISHPIAFKAAIKEMAEPFLDSGIDQVVSLESRGFIIGSPMALELNAGFVPIRKAGKLPGKTLQAKYSLEYGDSIIELKTGILKHGHNVLLVDDVLATGGTLEAAINLIEECGSNITGISVLLELKGLQGREKLKGYEINSLVQI